jgi:hypothetical protein
MSSEETKAIWAAKITEYSEYVRAFDTTRRDLGSFRGQNVVDMGPTPDHCHLMALDRELASSWFVHREAIREAVGVYPEPTAVLRWLRTCYVGVGQYFPHISKEDPTMVAYTPDRQAGLKDVQVRTTMGKLLRKFLLVVPDTEISRLESQHRAEMDTTFELATTTAAIEQVYTTCAGDSGCMRYDKGHWSHDLFHPSAVYSGPGMGVAYVQGADGRVMSRSVVWVNPADAADKRYVRVYGDPVLKRKLEANGYRCSGLAGARLAALSDPRRPDLYVMPYVDPAGGINSNSADPSNNSDYVVRYKGEEGLMMITADRRNALVGAGFAPAHVRTQEGAVAVIEIDPAEFSYTCALSGLVTDALAVSTGWFLTPEGKVVQARASNLSDLQYTCDVDGNRTAKRLSFIRNGKLVVAWGAKADAVKFAVPGYPQFFNDALTREYNNLCQLDPVHYGDTATYITRNEGIKTAAGTWLRKADALHVYDAAGESVAHHVSEAKALRKQGYVSVAPLGRIKAMSHPDSNYLATTAGGKKVLTHMHAVKRMFDGRYDYTANTTAFTLMGRSIRGGKLDSLMTVRMTKEQVAFTYRSDLVIMDDTDLAVGILSRVKSGLATDFRHYPTFQLVNDMLVERSYYDGSTLERLEAGARAVVALEATPDALAATLSYNADGALVWAHAAVHLIDLYREELSRRTAERAAAAKVALTAAIEALNADIAEAGTLSADDVLALAISDAHAF